MKAYKFYIGIDVSKLELDVAVMRYDQILAYQKVNNDTESILKYIQELKTISGFRISSTVFGMEETGIYCNHLVKALLSVKANFVKQGSLHIRNSLGNIRGKTDKIDSLRIATYLFKSRDTLNLYKPRRAIVQELSSLVTLRTRLISTRRALRTPLKEDRLFLQKQISNQSIILCTRTIEAIKSDIAEVEKRIEQVWNSDEKLRHLMNIITSVPYIGPWTALQIIICTNVFEDISSPKKFACYSGVAPFPHQSGTSVLKRNRVSKIANKKMKTLLHTCALLSKRYLPEIKEYYIRKTEIEGKNKMSVMNAIRSKLILRIFACVNQNRPYEYDYKSIGPVNAIAPSLDASRAIGCTVATPRTKAAE